MKKGPRKLKTHVNLDPLIGETLDAVAAKMGEDPLYPTPSRSDLLNKAARLFLEQCRSRPELRSTIEGIEARHAGAGQNVIRYPQQPPHSREGRTPNRGRAAGAAGRDRGDALE